MQINGSSDRVFELNPLNPVDTFIMYLGGNLLQNRIHAIPKTMIAEDVDCVRSFRVVTTTCDSELAPISLVPMVSVQL